MATSTPPRSDQGGPDQVRLDPELQPTIPAGPIPRLAATPGAAPPVDLDAFADDAMAFGAPAQIGPYKLQGLLGEGGMGAVYLASQEQPIHREVAIKLMKAPFASRAARLRFEAERQSLARLSHPNIAALFEAGTTDDGLPYFVMERVHGQPLTAYADHHQLDLAARLELFLAVCQGVGHAHQKGLIHRDIKPSNVMVTEVDGRPVPKVIDFGVAKSLGEASDATLLAGSRLVGTPAYLAPEALEGLTAEVDLDTRVDVYALGLLLYELLIGVLPHQIGGNSLAELARRLMEQDSPGLLARFATLPAEQRQEVAARRRTRPEVLHKALRGDLEWITARATARRRDDRYGSVVELVADLERFRRLEPVSAGPPSRTYRLRRALRRHRTAAIAAVAVLTSLLAGLVARSVEATRANREAKAAQEARAAAEAVANFMTEVFTVAAPDRSRGANITARELLDRGAQRIDESLKDQAAVRAQLLGAIGKSYAGLGLFAAAEPLARQAASAASALHGDDSREAVTALTELANVLSFGGKRAEAKEVALRALATQRALGGEPERVARLLEQLGTLERFANHFDQARDYFAESLAIRQQLDANSPATATSHYHLGLLALDQGDHATAERELRASLEMRERLHPADDWRLGGPLRGLADLYNDQNRLAEAEPLYQRALHITEQTVGLDHSAVAAILNNLGVLYYHSDRLDEAKVALERALAINQKALGADHLEIGYAACNLGLVALKQGDLNAAQAWFERGLELHLPQLAADDVALSWQFWGLGSVHLARGKLSAAEELLRRAYEIRKAAMAADGRDVVAARTSLAEVLERLGRGEEAGALAAEGPLGE